MFQTIDFYRSTNVQRDVSDTKSIDLNGTKLLFYFYLLTLNLLKELQKQITVIQITSNLYLINKMVEDVFLLSIQPYINKQKYNQSNAKTYQMTSPLIKKKITLKKWDHMFKHTEHDLQQKHFSPGILKFNRQDFPKDKSRLVNFFGDIHTEVFSLKVSADNKFVGAACSNGQVRVYNIYQGKIMNIGNTSRMAGYPCTGFKWKPINTEEFVTCNCDGTIKWYNLHQETAFGHYQNQNTGYLCCQYQAFQEWCAFGTEKSEIEIFDNQKMKPVHVYVHGGADELSSNHHNNRVFSIKCLKEDKNLFFSGGWDSTIQVWDVRCKEESVRKIYGPTISADSLDYKNGTILAGNYQNKDILQLWDFKSGELIQTLDIKQPPNGNSYCFAATFAHKSKEKLIGCALSGSNKVKVLRDKHTVTEVQLQAAPLAVDFYQYNDKDFMVVGGVQGTIYVIKLKWAV